MGLYNYGNIAKADSAKPGSCTILVAPLSYFSSIKTPTAHASAGQSKTISQTHTFEASKGFIKFLGNIKQKNTGKGSTIGEQGSRSMKHEITVPVAGMNAALLEFIEGGLNEEFIVLVGDACACDVEGATYLQYGCENVPATLMAESDLGTIEGGFKGNTLKFEAFGVPNVYTGTVTLYS